jgi:addiction module RelE/StbE family toxin
MKREFDFSPTFLKKAGKLLQKTPQIDPLYYDTLIKLAADPFNPLLHTHPLTGKLKGKYSCSVTYSLRIVFTLADDIIHLLDIGPHDEVY